MTPKEWLSLTPEQRNELANTHGLVKKGRTEVVDNVVVSDGYDPEDLLRIPLADLPVEGTESPIVHQIGTDERATDPQDTRTQKTPVVERTVAAEEVLIDVVAPLEGEATAVSRHEDVPPINETANEQSEPPKTE